MLSQSETFSPPAPEEEWADRQFSIILNYLSQYQVPFTGTILLKWLAAPYISVWTGKSTSEAGSTVWIMHNQLQTDHFIASSQISIREAIRNFGERWLNAGTELAANPGLKIDNPDEFGEPVKYAGKLIKYGEMFISVAADDELNF